MRDNLCGQPFREHPAACHCKPIIDLMAASVIVLSVLRLSAMMRLISAAPFSFALPASRGLSLAGGKPP